MPKQARPREVSLRKRTTSPVRHAANIASAVSVPGSSSRNTFCSRTMAATPMSAPSTKREAQDRPSRVRTHNTSTAADRKKELAWDIGGVT